MRSDWGAWACISASPPSCRTNSLQGAGTPVLRPPPRFRWSWWWSDGRAPQREAHGLKSCLAVGDVTESLRSLQLPAAPNRCAACPAQPRQQGAHPLVIPRARSQREVSATREDSRAVALKCDHAAEAPGRLTQTAGPHPERQAHQVWGGA